jgi:predicted GNAT family N-acyltransferase
MFCSKKSHNGASMDDENNCLENRMEMSVSMIIDKYELKLEMPSVAEFSQLRKKIGWGDLAAEMAKHSLIHSLFHVTIRDKAQLIAMGRVVGDGSMYFYIQDVIVDPDYQNQGLGHVVMSQIESYLLKAAKKGATIGLLAAQGKEEFYTRYGYILRPDQSLGHGMCKFIK